MISVAVCDDEPSVCETLCEYLTRYAAKHKTAVETRVYHSGAELIKGGRCDLMLLDIEMPEMNGMDAARLIRKRDEDVTIVFITNMVQYAIEGYEVQAYRFLEKPVDYNKFERVIGGALKLAQDRSSCAISIKNENGLTRIRAADILYAETASGHVVLNCRFGAIECFQTMASMEKELAPQSFFRCHSAYLVNMAKVDRLLQKELVLSNGAAIPVSKHRRRQLVEALTDYWGGILL